MPLNLSQPITYLITSGATTPASTPISEDFQSVLALIRAAVGARLTLIQLREKNLNARVLYELAARSAEITLGTATRLLVNDRADIARAAGADGVHLTAHSIAVSITRRTFGTDFLIGVSTHSLAEATVARDGGANFAVFGPIFDTPSKRGYGAPLGLGALHEAAQTLAPFPLIALGGITLENAGEVLRAGAGGVAAIRLFSDRDKLEQITTAIRGAGI